MIKLLTNYELRPRKDRRGYDLIFGSLRVCAFRWPDPELAIAYAKFSSDCNDAESERSTGREKLSNSGAGKRLGLTPRLL
jgi:hypothetical protein